MAPSMPAREKKRENISNQAMVNLVNLPFLVASKIWGANSIRFSSSSSLFQRNPRVKGTIFGQAFLIQIRLLKV